MPLNLTLLFIFLFFLTGCASFDPNYLSKSDCSAMDAYDFGLRDGANGKSDDYQNLANRCEKQNIKIDGPQYSAGWNEGSRMYCTPDTAFTLGKSDADYPGHCPLDTQTNTFQSEYQRGQHLAMTQS